MSGGGMGDVLGAIAPIALGAMDPELIPALGGDIAGITGFGAGTADALASGGIGALTSGGIAALTGGNPLQSALLGGVGAGLGSELMPTPTGASGASGVGASPDVPALGDSGSGLGSAGSNSALFGGSGDASSLGWGSSPSDLSLSSAPTAASGAAAAGTPPATGGIGAYLAKQNPLALALAGTTGLSALQTLMNPLPKYNVQGTANSVMATNPSFNAALPKYTQQNTGTPYQGNWYTYGQSPQPAMYNAMPQPVKHGGLMKYAHGGPVRGYAMGGAPMMPPGAPPAPMPPAMPPQGMPPQGAPPMPQKPVNPLALQTAHQVGVAIGKHIKSKMKTPAGPVSGPGGGQDDAIPAKLSDGEFIMPADVVSQLGDGSSNAGGKKLTGMIHNVRQHKATKTFPPKAKSPLSYLPKKGNA